VILVALKMLVGDRLKYIGLVAGLTFAVTLITQQAAIMGGFMSRMGSFVRDTGPADLWVMDPQRRFSEDLKPMNDTALGRVRGIDGVEWAVPMYKNWIRCRLPDGTLTQTIVVGLDDATLLGGPPEIVEGSLEELRRDGGVLIDHDERDGKMKMLMGGGRGLCLGDRLSFNDTDAVVVGTFRISRSFFWEPTVYTTFSRAARFAPAERRTTSFVLVKVREGHTVADVQRRIEGATGLAAYTSEQFERKTTDFLAGSTGIKANFGLAILLGFVIGLLVSGQTLYQFTLDNLRHFAALKAMGATDFMLIRMVCTQVLVVGAAGYGVGLGAASLLGTLIDSMGLAFQMSWGIPVFSGAAMLGICLVAGVLSLARVLRLEPGIVFKS
jgi:putative ABC transport system permease protein